MYLMDFVLMASIASNGMFAKCIVDWVLNSEFANKCFDMIGVQW